MSNRHGMHWIRDDKRQAIYHRDGDACVWCGSRESLTLDHLTPRDRGGTNDADNLVTACHPCNSERQHRPLEEWSTSEQRAEVVRRALFVEIDREEGKRRVAARKAARANAEEQEIAA